MWRVIVVLACVVWLGGVRAGLAQAEPVSKRQFTEDTVQALKAATPGLTVDITGDLQLTFRRENGNDGAIDLNNLYTAYRLEPARHDDLLKRLVASFNEGAQPSGAKAPAGGAPGAGQPDSAKLTANVVPVIKPRAWLDEFKSKLEGAQQEPVFDEYNKELIIVYAEDTPSRTRYLTSADKLDVPRDKLREVALGNLQRILPEIKFSALEEGRLYLLDADGDNNASLLLLDKIWADPRLKLEGDVVVALPVRDIVMVAGSKDRKALKVLRSAAKKWYAEGPHSLTESLFVRRNGKFAKYGR
jgi:uncharacterized protein YtpQ (UPF0354 family)